MGLVSACGGDDGSGVDGDKPITELSAEEASQLCEWSIEVQNGEGYSEDCGDFTYQVGTVAECRAGLLEVPDACSEVTVADLEACTEAIAEDPCNGLGAQACLEYFQYSFGDQ